MRRLWMNWLETDSAGVDCCLVYEAMPAGITKRCFVWGPVLGETVEPVWDVTYALGAMVGILSAVAIGGWCIIDDLSSYRRMVVDSSYVRLIRCVRLLALKPVMVVGVRGVISSIYFPVGAVGLEAGAIAVERVVGVMDVSWKQSEGSSVSMMCLGETAVPQVEEADVV